MLGAAGVAVAAMAVRSLRHTRTRPGVLARLASTEKAEPSQGRKFRIALCQLSVSDDKPANLKAAAKAIQEASLAGAHLISLPECFQSPYATDQFRAYAETIPDSAADIDPETQPSMAMLHEEAKRNNIYIVGGSIPERGEGDRIFNTCVVFGPNGDILARHRKMHLFDISIPGKITFRESDTLTAGDDFASFKFIKPAASEDDIEDPVTCKIGIGICYDMRFAEMAQIHRANGCDMLIYPGAFNTTTGPLHWELLQRARAVDNQVFFAACSPARSESPEGYQAWGHSTIVDPVGKIVATCEHKPTMVVGDIDLDIVTSIRANIPISHQKRLDVYQSSTPLAQ